MRIGSISGSVDCQPLHCLAGIQIFIGIIFMGRVVHNALIVSACAGNVYFLTMMYPTKISPPHSIVCVCVSVAIVTGSSIVYGRYDSLSGRENLHQVVWDCSLRIPGDTCHSYIHITPSCL